jgi:iron(III) transport system ATP-binding protein
MTPVLTLHEVSKSFQRGMPVLQHVSLRVETGTMVCLLGPSGCGKTTLLRLIAGFEEPDAGEIHLLKQLVSRPGLVVPPEQRHIGMVFQDYALFPHLTVSQNIQFGLGRWLASWRRARLTAMLQLVGLEGLGHRYPHEISGGQQQRVALARALAPNPQLLLLDEPFSNLDINMRRQLREEMQEILAQSGITTVLVTHDQEEALSLANALAIIDQGQMAQFGAPDDIIQQPRTRFVAEFLELGHFLRGDRRQHCLATELGAIPLMSDWSLATNCRVVDVLVRPEQLQLCNGLHGTPAQVVHVSFHGLRKLYTVRLPSGTLLRGLFPDDVSLPPGAQVRVTLRHTGFVVFPHAAAGV